MQSVCIGRSRLEGFYGRFFRPQLVFWSQVLSGMAAQRLTGHHGASQGLTRLHGLTGFMAAQRLTGHHSDSRTPRRFAVHRSAQIWVTRAVWATAFGSRLGHRISLEPLCFSIDSSVSSLLPPMIPKKSLKVSRIGNSMQSVCIEDLGLEGF